MGCTQCRIRKVKCSGEYPQCETCRKFRPSITCIYAGEQRRTMLKRRQACLPCRKKKRRCDAIRPTCTTCQIAWHKDFDSCVYLDNGPQKSTCNNTAVNCRSSSQQIQSSSHTAALSSQVGKSGSLGDIPLPLAVISHRMLIAAEKPRFWLGSEAAGGLHNSALSKISPEDLNLTFRMLYLSQRMTYGIYLPFAKLRALVNADLSGAFIHPFFVHFSHLVGVQFWQERVGRYCLLHLQAGYFRSTLDAFSSMREDSDPLSLAQACLLMSSADGMIQGTESPRLLRRCLRILRRNRIGFFPIPSNDSSLNYEPPEFSEHVYERVAFLAHIVASEAFFYISCQPTASTTLDSNDPKSSSPPQAKSHHEYCKGLFEYSEVYGADEKLQDMSLNDQFRYKLPEAYPTLFETCPIMLRSRSLLLAKDANNIIAWFHEAGMLPGLWLATCRTFLSHLTTHADNLSEKLAVCRETNDREEFLALSLSSILSLTTLAQIFITLAQYPEFGTPARVKFTQECNVALQSMLSIVAQWKPLELRFMDVYLGVHWTCALHTFNHPTTAATADFGLHTLEITTSYDELPLPLQSDLKANISRLAQLNRDFIDNRLLPGTASLYSYLTTQLGSKNKNNSRQ